MENLKLDGAISEEEFRREKDLILNISDNQSRESNPLGMKENDYLALMHVSQFAGFFIIGLGFIIPIILWQIAARRSEVIDKHGRNIVNFILSLIIYYAVLFASCILLVSLYKEIVYLLAFVVSALAVIFAVAIVTLIIIAVIKASRGEFWKYPLSIQFFRYKK
nr:DUF4870 domain-containing protein [Dysgonomonas sp. 521]